MEKEKQNCVRRSHASGMKPSNACFDVVPLLRNYGRERHCIERCMEWLEEEEQLLLEKLYIVPKEGNVDYLCGKLEVEKTTVYRRGRKALRRFAALYAAIRALQ